MNLHELQRRAGVAAITGTTSASEAVLLQRTVDEAVQKALESAIPAALSEQRERIADAVRRTPAACNCHSVGEHDFRCAWRLRNEIAAGIRSGEIGGEQK